jgi:hypothetical protein
LQAAAAARLAVVQRRLAVQVGAAVKVWLDLQALAAVAAAVAAPQLQPLAALVSSSFVIFCNLVR